MTEMFCARPQADNTFEVHTYLLHPDSLCEMCGMYGVHILFIFSNIVNCQSLTKILPLTLSLAKIKYRH